jgi:hypothetical protein
MRSAPVSYKSWASNIPLWLWPVPSWLWLVLVVAVFLALGAFPQRAHFIDWATMVGEFTIAGVIWYEIEANRTSAFLAEVQGEDSSRKRAKLYDAYARLNLTEAATLKQRAEEFEKKIWADPWIREACDLQWTYFCRLALLDRRLATKWFPQVIVSFWVMTAVYNREYSKRRAAPLDGSGVKVVKDSLKKMRRRGKPLMIYSNDGKLKVEILVSEFEKMLRASLDDPLG